MEHEWGSCLAYLAAVGIIGGCVALGIWVWIDDIAKQMDDGDYQ